MKEVEIQKVEDNAVYRPIQASFILTDEPQFAESHINYNELVFKKQIGKGAFGEVWRGKWHDTDVAIKKLLDALDEKQQKEFVAEAKVMKSLRNHPNVVLFIGVTRSPYPLCIVTEFLEKGSLQDFLSDHPNLELEIRMNIVRGIARGMLHLHSQNIVHRDLAARNILLTNTLEPKVSDFGMSRYVSENTGTTLSTIGPLKWMSPESIVKKKYSLPSDVWSFGVLLFEIFSNREPYPELDAVQAALQVCEHGLRLTPSDNTPQIIKDIMFVCFQTDPSKRPFFSQITVMLKISDE